MKRGIICFETFSEQIVADEKEAFYQMNRDKTLKIVLTKGIGVEPLWRKGDWRWQLLSAYHSQTSSSPASAIVPSNPPFAITKPLYYLARVLLEYLKDDSVKAFTLRLSPCIVLSGKRQMNAKDWWKPPFFSLHENLEEKLPRLSKYFVVLHKKGKDGIVVFVLG